MATTKSAARLCVVTIGLDEYLLPAAAGIKVAELMQLAKPVRSHYESGEGYRYYPIPESDETRDVMWKAVSAAQIAEGKRARRSHDEPEAS